MPPQSHLHPRIVNPRIPHATRLRRVLGATLWMAALATSFLAGIAGNTIARPALVGPFLDEPRGWTPLPGGDFEDGPTDLPINATYGPLVGDMELFVSKGAEGTAQRSTQAAFKGNSGVHIRPGRFEGPGIALTYYKTLKLAQGQSVVLSAFVKRLHPAGSQASVALDFWGAPGTTSIPVPATTSEWQFIHGVFSPSADWGQVTVGARLTIDGTVAPTDEVYVDELSLTPLNQFSPPQPVSSPQTFGAEGSAILANGFVVGIQLSSGGSGYTKVPNVLILGGGGTGATAVATVSNGFVTGIRMTSAGMGYTNSPLVRIDPPVLVPAPPFSISMEVKTVTVTLTVSVGRIYLLESSGDLKVWTAVGDPFEASSTSVKQDFDVAGRPAFFRLRDVTYGQ